EPSMEATASHSEPLAPALSASQRYLMGALRHASTDGHAAVGKVKASLAAARFAKPAPKNDENQSVNVKPLQVPQKDVPRSRTGSMGWTRQIEATARWRMCSRGRCVWQDWLKYSRHGSFHRCPPLSLVRHGFGVQRHLDLDSHRRVYHGHLTLALATQQFSNLFDRAWSNVLADLRSTIEAYYAPRQVQSQGLLAQSELNWGPAAFAQMGADEDLVKHVHFIMAFTWPPRAVAAVACRWPPAYLQPAMAGDVAVPGKAVLARVLNLTRRRKPVPSTSATTTSVPQKSAVQREWQRRVQWAVATPAQRTFVAVGDFNFAENPSQSDLIPRPGRQLTRNDDIEVAADIPTHFSHRHQVFTAAGRSFAPPPPTFAPCLNCQLSVAQEAASLADVCLGDHVVAEFAVDGDLATAAELARNELQRLALGTGDSICSRVAAFHSMIRMWLFALIERMRLPLGRLAAIKSRRAFAFACASIGEDIIPLLLISSGAMQGWAPSSTPTAMTVRAAATGPFGPPPCWRDPRAIVQFLRHRARAPAPPKVAAAPRRAVAADALRAAELAAELPKKPRLQWVCALSLAANFAQTGCALRCRSECVPGVLGSRRRVELDGVRKPRAGNTLGGDFTVQFQVAYSSLLRGSAIIAGQPYHCALTFFRGEGGSKPPYDHCKSKPGIVNVSQLVEYAKDEAAAGSIDDLSNLKSARVYLFEGTEDSLYRGNAKLVKEFFSHFLDPVAQMKSDEDLPCAVLGMTSPFLAGLRVDITSKIERMLPCTGLSVGG
ncbi:unnamed protein product, partial [Prorocentrum cordatum]